jgi:hypothetical protein
MDAPKYSVPASAPVWVRNILKGSPSRRSVQTLIWLSILAAAAGVCAARWDRSSLVALIFLYYAFLAWAALRWADQNGVFPKPNPTFSPGPPDTGQPSRHP